MPTPRIRVMLAGGTAAGSAGILPRTVQSVAGLNPTRP